MRCQEAESRLLLPRGLRGQCCCGQSIIIIIINNKGMEMLSAAGEMRSDGQCPKGRAHTGKVQAGLRSRPTRPVPVGDALQANERKAEPSFRPSWKEPFPVVTLTCHEQPKNSPRRKLAVAGGGGGHQQECCTACFCCLGLSGA